MSTVELIRDTPRFVCSSSLLREGGDVAEENGATKITDKHIEVAVDRVQRGRVETEEGVTADVVEVGVDFTECSENPGGLTRRVVDTADVRDHPPDVDTLDRLAAQRDVRTSEYRHVVAAVNERSCDLVLLAFGPARARLDPRPEVGVERVRDETDVWGI